MAYQGSYKNPKIPKQRDTQGAPPVGTMAPVAPERQGGLMQRAAAGRVRQTKVGQPPIPTPALKAEQAPPKMAPMTDPGQRRDDLERERLRLKQQTEQRRRAEEQRRRAEVMQGTKMPDKPTDYRWEALQRMAAKGVGGEEEKKYPTIPKPGETETDMHAIGAAPDPDKFDPAQEPVQPGGKLPFDPAAKPPGYVAGGDETDDPAPPPGIDDDEEAIEGQKAAFAEAEKQKKEKAQQEYYANQQQAKAQADDNKGVWVKDDNGNYTGEYIPSHELDEAGEAQPEEDPTGEDPVEEEKEEKTLEDWQQQAEGGKVWYDKEGNEIGKVDANGIFWEKQKDGSWEAKGDVEKSKASVDLYNHMEKLGHYSSGPGGESGIPQEGLVNQAVHKFSSWMSQKTGIPEEELQGQIAQVYMQSAEQIAKFANLMAARGVGAGGLMGAGMGQIAAQAVAAVANIRFENEKLKIEEKLNKMKTMAALTGQFMSEQNRMEIFEQMNQLEKQKFDYTAEQDAIANQWTDLSDMVALLQADNGWEDYALTQAKQALDSGKSADWVMKHLMVGTDGKIKWSGYFEGKTAQEYKKPEFGE